MPGTTDIAPARAYPDFMDGTQACGQVDNPDIFFPRPGEPADAAIQVCRRCPLKKACFDWAMATEQRFGVWGATSSNMRARLFGRAEW